jgi:hypothetical protein
MLRDRADQRTVSLKPRIFDHLLRFGCPLAVPGVTRPASPALVSLTSSRGGALRAALEVRDVRTDYYFVGEPTGVLSAGRDSRYQRSLLKS